MLIKNWQGLKIEIVLDGDSFLATCEDFPVYGVGATEEEAFKDFKVSLFELKDDLYSDEITPYSPEWQEVKTNIAKFVKD